VLNSFQWFSLVCIFAATLAGGYYPLFHRDDVKRTGGMPLGEAFTAGVFLALALTMMLPSSLHLLGAAFPQFDFPTGALVASVAFLLLLAMEHRIAHMAERSGRGIDSGFPPVIPLTMTTMIAVPSFFLGAALGVSETEAAILIFIAIILHKTSAAFALSLQMVRSTMSNGQARLAFLLFACATPLGIVVGEELHHWLGPESMMVVKGLVLGLAAGTFVFMATLHELGHAPMISRCASRRGFLLMLAGFLMTVLVRFVIGEAHSLSP
jgi:zinc transporter ZupT